MVCGAMWRPTLGGCIPFPTHFPLHFPCCFPHHFPRCQVLDMVDAKHGAASQVALHAAQQRVRGVAERVARLGRTVSTPGKMQPVGGVHGGPGQRRRGGQEADEGEEGGVAQAVQQRAVLPPEVGEVLKVMEELGGVEAEVMRVEMGMRR